MRALILPATTPRRTRARWREPPAYRLETKSWSGWLAESGAERRHLLQRFLHLGALLIRAEHGFTADDQVVATSSEFKTLSWPSRGCDSSLEVSDPGTLRAGGGRPRCGPGRWTRCSPSLRRFRCRAGCSIAAGHQGHGSLAADERHNLRSTQPVAGLDCTMRFLRPPVAAAGTRPLHQSRERPVASVPGAQRQHVLGSVFRRKHDAGEALTGGRLHELIGP